MQKLNVILRRARTLLWTALSIVIIAAAILVGVGKLLMPYSQRYQPQLEAWLSEEFGQPVTLKSFTGEWKAFGPRLSLRGMSLKSSSGRSEAIAISEAALDLKPLNIFFSDKALYNFGVVGADFQLVHKADGSYELSGFGVSGPESEDGDAAWRNLVGIGELILEKSSLEYVDELRQVRLHLAQIDARLQLDDDSLALELQASLLEPSTARIFGEVDATTLIELGSERGIDEARWQLTIRDLMLAPLGAAMTGQDFLPQQGRVSAELWGDWVAGRPLIVRGVADLRDGLLERSGEVLAVEHINSNLAWKYAGRGDWRLDLNEFLFEDTTGTWTSQRITLAQQFENNIGLWVSADYLPIEIPMALARKIMGMWERPWPDSAPMSADGEVTDLEFALDSDWRLRRFYGTARQAGVEAWGKWPGLRGLDADIRLDASFGSARLHARQLEIDWPDMFGGPLAFSLPTCHLDWQKSVDWQVTVPRCSLLNDAIALDGRMLIRSDEGRPTVDINVHVPRGNIEQFSDLWPIGVMPAASVDWLKSRIARGSIQSGRFQIFGDMDDWPFREGRGRFEAIALIDNAELLYYDGWPRASEIAATARFEGASMNIESRIGRTGRASVQQASAKISDFKKPNLVIEYQTKAPLNALLDYVENSPLAETIGTDLSIYELGGDTEVSGQMRVPLGSQPGEFSIDGQIQLDGNTFTDTTTAITLDSLEGILTYSRSGLSGTGIMGNYNRQSTSIDLLAGIDQTERFRVDATGNFSVADMLPDYIERGLKEFPAVPGTTRWDISVIVPGESYGGRQNARVEVSSDLQGLALQLPPPLQKAESEIWPLKVIYPLAGDRRLLRLNLLQKAHVNLDLVVASGEDEQLSRIDRALVQFEDGPADLPEPGLIRIGGVTDRLDLDEWVAFITDQARRSGGLDQLGLEPVELTCQELVFLDRLYSDVTVLVELEDDNIKASFAGVDIDGEVIYTPDAATGSLTAEFERLVLDQPVDSGLNMQSDPADLPELHLFARSFRYSGIELGETRIEAFPRAGGFHFEKVETMSDALSLRATGDWSLTQGLQRSDFNITVTSESLGALLNSLEISSSLEGGQTLVHFNAWWPGSPAAFALSRLNGELDFTVSRGQITNASAGSGRLLGLLSIQALPRRLSLDFRDVFDSGFDFEGAQGTFRLQNGMATTDDLELSSSAATIAMQGSTDLVKKQYDQVMIVKPGVGNTLPVIGALAGGPGGAAAGLALQGLLHKQLGEATQVRYSITGSWDEPVIEPILKESDPDSGRDSEAPGSTPVGEDPVDATSNGNVGKD